MNDDGSIVVNAALDASGGATGSVAAGNGGTIQLKTAQVASAASTITQSAALTATGATGGLLKVNATDNVTLQTAGNDVAKLAANISTAGKFFKYSDTNALAVDTVGAAGTLTAPSSTGASQASMSGIKTLGGAVVVAASGTGTLDVNQAILTTPTVAGTAGGSVILEAGGAITSATAGTITTTGAANTGGVGGLGIAPLCGQAQLNHCG